MNSLISLSQLERSLHHQRRVATSIDMARSFTTMQLGWVEGQSWRCLPAFWGTSCERADAVNYYREQLERYDVLKAGCTEERTRLEGELQRSYQRLAEQFAGSETLDKRNTGAREGPDQSAALRACAAVLRSAYKDKVPGPEISGEQSIGDTDHRPISLVPFAHTDCIAKLQSTYSIIKTAQKDLVTATAHLSMIDQLRDDIHRRADVDKESDAADAKSSLLSEVNEAWTAAKQQEHLARLKMIASQWSWQHWLKHASGVDYRLAAVVRSTIEAMDPNFALVDITSACQETAPDDHSGVQGSTSRSKGRSTARSAEEVSGGRTELDAVPGAA